MPGATRPYSAELGTGAGSISTGTSSARQSSLSQRRRSMSKSMVREQLEKSEMCSRPPVRVPDEPGIDVAEEQLALLGPLARAGDVVQYPLDLGAGKIGVDQQPRLVADIGPSPSEARRSQMGAVRRHCQTMALIDGPARCAVPDDGRLALVGDADGGDVAALEATFFQTPPPARRTARTKCPSGRAPPSRGGGYICGNGRCASETISPFSLKMMARELVVPWSRAITWPFMPCTSVSLTLPRF